tara:strand:+ start:5018 stop:5803 length:786 start_codon:yes stop_codon:yes gene_type:complete
MGTDVKKTNGNLPVDLLNEIEANEGLGCEFTSDEMQMPYIRIAQSSNDEVKKSHAKFIEGLGQGDIFNNLTKEYWSDSLEVIPCHVKTTYTEWIKRTEGGGFIGEIDPKDPVLQQTEREGATETLPNGHQVVKADNYVVLVKSSDGSWTPAILDMKATQLKISRRWKTQLNLQTVKNPKTGKIIKCPIFTNIWTIKTVEETNADQYSYFNYSVMFKKIVEDKDLFNQAMSLFSASKAGEIKVQAPEQKSDEPQGEETKIPF